MKKLDTPKPVGQIGVQSLKMNKKKQITLVVPTFNESANLCPFCESLGEVIGEMEKYQWEIVFVDDGSSDNSWEIIQGLANHDSRIRGVSLSRNFGKEVAMTAGVESVNGADAIIFMDGDLQHPPPIIKDLVLKWEEGFQIVATKRLAIKYSPVRQLGSRLFYYMLNRFSDLKIESMATDFRLLDREVVKVLRTFKERTRFFRGLVDWMGFRRTFVSFSAPKRLQGSSTFKIRDLARLAINSFTAFSLFPLRVTGWMGLFVVVSAAMTMIYMVVTHLIFHITLYTPLAYFVVFNTLLFGVVLAALGMMALYIGHIHTEVVGRPLYIVQDKAGFKDG